MKRSVAEKFQELINGRWAMIKKVAVRVGSIICISVLVLSLTIFDVAWAQTEGNYIVSTSHSCM